MEELGKMKCPVCTESIYVSAKKCRFCGEWLDGRNSRSTRGGNVLAISQAAADGIKKKEKKGWQWVVTISAGDFIWGYIVMVTGVCVGTYMLLSTLLSKFIHSPAVVDNIIGVLIVAGVVMLVQIYRRGRVPR